MDQPDSGIRVGQAYQAEIPEFSPDIAAVSSEDYRNMVWCPNARLSDAMLDEYILIAREQHSYNTEQALGMLLWQEHDVERALADLPNFTPVVEEEWTVEDKVQFEQAFSRHGKDFNLLHQMLPDKPVSCLVKFYYTWKKTRSKAPVKARRGRRRTFPPSEKTLKKNSRWTTEEQLLVVQGIRRHGKNFEAIAEVIGSKSPAQVRTFITRYCHRFHLDEVLREWAATPAATSHGQSDSEDVESKTSSSSSSSSPLPAFPVAPPSASHSHRHPRRNHRTAPYTTTRCTCPCCLV